MTLFYSKSFYKDEKYLNILLQETKFYYKKVFPNAR